MKRTLQKILVNLTVVLITALVIFPVLYILSTSFEKSGTLSTSLIPANFTLDHWRFVLGLPVIDARTGQPLASTHNVLLWLWNSIKVSSIVSFLTLTISALAAYGVYRFRFSGKRGILISLLLLQMFPAMMGMVALYLLIAGIGRAFPMFGLDTHSGLVLVYLGATPFNIWLIMGYFKTIPRSLVECALIDGASEWQTFVRIVLPLAKPILAVITLIIFIMTFADFLLPSILIKDPLLTTFAVGMRNFVQESQAIRWGQFAAAAILGGMPVTALFLFVQKYLSQGMARGAVKE